MLALTVVLIRLIGVYYLVGWGITLTAVMTAMQGMEKLQDPPDNALLLVLFPAILAVMVIVLAEPIAAVISPKKKEGDVAECRLTQEGFLRVGVVLIGIFAIVQGLNPLVGYLVLRGPDQGILDIWKYLIGPAFGLALIVWARLAPLLLPKDLEKSRADYRAERPD